MRDIWTAVGWDGISPVMRLEFQLERTALVEMGIHSVADLLPRLASLWLYCAAEWLQLKIPKDSESTPSRWEDDPFWPHMVSAWKHSLSAVTAVRSRKQRIPEDERLFVHGLGGITSFMATRNITDLTKGINQFVEAAREFHGKSKSHGKTKASLGTYVKAKVLDKGRRFNTIRTRIKTAEDRAQIAKAADTYRQASKGE